MTWKHLANAVQFLKTSYLSVEVIPYVPKLGSDDCQPETREHYTVEQGFDTNHPKVPYV